METYKKILFAFFFILQEVTLKNTKIQLVQFIEGWSLHIVIWLYK